MVTQHDAWSWYFSRSAVSIDGYVMTASADTNANSVAAPTSVAGAVETVGRRRERSIRVVPFHRTVVQRAIAVGRSASSVAASTSATGTATITTSAPVRPTASVAPAYTSSAAISRGVLLVAVVLLLLRLMLVVVMMVSRRHVLIPVGGRWLGRKLVLVVMVVMVMRR